MTSATTCRAVAALLLLCLSSLTAASIETISSSNLTFSEENNWSEQLRTLSQTSLTSCLGSIKYVAKGGKGYEDLRTRVDNAAYLNRYPNYIISPSSEAQVQTTIKCLVQTNTPFVIRSGGHSYRGMSILGCGAIVDLYNMRSIKYNADGSTVTVGAGVRLGPLYRSLWLKGKKIFPAGTCPSVGASGLLLSGGHGLLSRKLSMSVDSIQSARCVLLDGSVVIASSTQNPNLFKALKGGSGSYCVVTSWTLKFHSAPKVYTQLEMGWTWSTDTAKKVGNALFASQPWTWPEDVTVVRLYYQTGKPNAIRAVIHYWGSKAQMQAFMKTKSFFSSVPPYKQILFSEGEYIEAALRGAALGTDKVITLSQWTNNRVGSGGAGIKSYLSTYVSKSIPPAGVDVMVNWASSGSGVTMTFMGGAIKNFGGSALDDHRNELLLIQFLASGGSRDSKIAEITSNFRPYNDGQQYIGYIGAVPSGSNPFSVFFGNQAVFLQGLKKQYDPKNRLGAINLPSCK